jgi:hypothetical protein
VIEEENLHIQQLTNTGPVPVDNHSDEDIITKGKLWNQIRLDKRFREYINFTEAELQSIWFDMQPFIEEAIPHNPSQKYVIKIYCFVLSFGISLASVMTNLPLSHIYQLPQYTLL